VQSLNDIMRLPADEFGLFSAHSDSVSRLDIAVGDVLHGLPGHRRHFRLWPFASVSAVQRYVRYGDKRKSVDRAQTDVIDSKRPFATVNCRTAKGSFDRYYGANATSLAAVASLHGPPAREANV